MSKENFERGPAEEREKTDLETKVDQLSMMRKKKALLELKRKVPMPISEGEKINAEYGQVCELIDAIEKDIDLTKENERVRLEKKFEHPTEAANESDFDKALYGTGEGQKADKLDARRRAA
jgi:hypothetical protein